MIGLQVLYRHVGRRSCAYICGAIVWAAGFSCFASGQTAADVYLQDLKQLDVSRPESVCTARDLLRGVMTTASADERDEMFRSFRAFYLRSIRMTAPAFEAAMDKYTSDYEEWRTNQRPTGSMKEFLRARPDVAKAGSRWFNCGFLMDDSEGSLYATADPAALLEFSDELTPSLRSYIRFRSDEDREIVIADACLQISWEQLRLRLQRWEDFGRDHPKLLETKSEINPSIRLLALFYLFGSDNTATFNLRNGRLEPELVSSWREFAAHDRSSRYYSLISSLLTRIDEQGGKLTKKDRVLFERFGMEQEFDEWWKVLVAQVNQAGGSVSEPIK